MKPYAKLTPQEKFERALRVCKPGTYWKIDVDSCGSPDWYKDYQGLKLKVIDVHLSGAGVRVNVELPTSHKWKRKDFPYHYLMPYNVDPDEQRERCRLQKKYMEEFIMSHTPNTYPLQNVKKAMWAKAYGAGQETITEVLNTGETKRRVSKKFRRLQPGQQVQFKGRIGDVLRYMQGRRSYEVVFQGNWIEEITEEQLINCEVLTLIKQESQMFKVESYVEINGTKVEELPRAEFIRLVQAEQKRLTSLQESAKATGSAAIKAEVVESEEALAVAIKAYDEANVK